MRLYFHLKHPWQSITDETGIELEGGIDRQQILKAVEDCFEEDPQLSAETVGWTVCEQQHLEREVAGLAGGPAFMELRDVGDGGPEGGGFPVRAAAIVGYSRMTIRNGKSATCSRRQGFPWNVANRALLVGRSVSADG